jgi:SAM-dependent methyltransferase
MFAARPCQHGPVSESTTDGAVTKDLWGDQSAQKWVRRQEQTDAQLGPLGLPAVDALGLRPGERVLDVGCGAGQTLLQLAERVAPGGWVTGLDISEPLLQQARERIARSGQPRVDLVLGDAETARLEAPPYDALFSRFGVMFFEDPAAAFANLARALRPGARLAFLCWQGLDRNPWALRPLEAVRSLAPELPVPEMLLPDRPGPFRFGAAELVRGYLTKAGLTDVTVTPHETEMLLGGARTVDEAVDFALEIGPTARFVGQLAPERRAQARGALARVFEAALAADGVRMTARTFVVTARVSAAGRV